MEGSQIFGLTHSMSISCGLSFHTLQLVTLKVYGSRKCFKFSFSSSDLMSMMIWSCFEMSSHMCLIIPSYSRLSGKQKTLLIISFLCCKKSRTWSIAHSLMKIIFLLPGRFCSINSWSFFTCSFVILIPRSCCTSSKRITWTYSIDETLLRCSLRHIGSPNEVSSKRG